MITNKKPKTVWTLNRDLSDSEVKVYAHSFPIITHNKTVVISGEFLYFSNSDTIKINVYDCNNGTLYPPFYQDYYGNYKPILKKIENVIIRECGRIGLYVDDNNVRM